MQVKKWVGTPILLRDATFDKRETTQKNEIISFFFNEEYVSCFIMKELYFLIGTLCCF